MATPHDYYANKPYPLRDPRLHNRGEGKDYIEPDWFANHHDGALPTLSTIGKGPQGYGIEISKDEFGNLVVASEDPMQEPIIYHLGDWNIWVTQKANGEIVEGQNTEFDIHISDGNDTKKYTIIIPCGSHGSRVYFGDGGPYEWREDNTYQIRNILYGAITPHELRFPEPRVGDIVIFKVEGYEDANGPYPNGQVASGTVEAFGEDSEGLFMTVFAPVLWPLPVYRYADFEDKPSVNGVELQPGSNTLYYKDLPDHPVIDGVELHAGSNTLSYNDLPDHPAINGIELVGNTQLAYSDLAYKPEFNIYEHELLPDDSPLKIKVADQLAAIVTPVIAANLVELIEPNIQHQSDQMIRIWKGWFSCGLSDSEQKRTQITNLFSTVAGRKVMVLENDHPGEHWSIVGAAYLYHYQNGNYSALYPISVTPGIDGYYISIYNLNDLISEKVNNNYKYTHLYINFDFSVRNRIPNDS